MRSLLALGTSALLAVTASAQATPNLFEIYPDATGASTTFTSRGTLTTAPGEVLQEVPATLFAGIGDAGAAGCSTVGMVYATQDQLGTTPETYFLVLRKDAMGMPDVSATGAISVAGPLTTPANTTAGPIAWVITATYNTPVALPCANTYYMGLQLAAAPGWTATPADGQSVHVAYYAGATTVGDNPRVNAPNHAWQYNSMTMTIGQPTPRCWRVGVRVNPPVLNMANVDPLSTRSPGGVSYGAGGMYPKTADGVNARVRDMANTGGMAFLLIGPTVLPIGLQIPLFAGSVWLSPSGPIISGGSASLVSGEALFTLVPPGKLPAALAGTVHFQGVTVDATLGNPRFTNAAGSNF